MRGQINTCNVSPVSNDGRGLKQNRSKTIADNVLKNNALLAKLNMRGNVRTISGGNTILEELSFAQNGNAGFYSGYDLLPVAAQVVVETPSGVIFDTLFESPLAV